MQVADLEQILLYIQRIITFLGGLVILTGILVALYHYFCFYFQNNGKLKSAKSKTIAIISINQIRLNLARTLLLGLEFIIAADLIGTTTAPDYYSLGILAIIVLVRTFLSFSLNRELISLNKEKSAA